MDRVIEAVPDATAARKLVFPSNLLRPWLVANFGAFAIGAGVAGAVLRGLLQPAIENAVTRIEVARIGGTSTGAAALILGATLGIGQWLVLRRAIRAAWWAPATCLGWILVGSIVGFNNGGASWDTRPEAGPITPFILNIVVLPAIVVLLSA